MLYIFNFLTGQMVSLDLESATFSVKELKELIDQKLMIPLDKQILMISGGKPLQESDPVCNYSAGTETNPIFLFDKTVIDQNNSPACKDQRSVKEEYLDALIVKHRSQSSPLTVKAVGERFQFVQTIYDVSKEIAETCEKLVHYQHLQQQGWSSTMVNIEDLIDNFLSLEKFYNDVMVKYHNMYDSCIKNSAQFERNLEHMKSIPLDSKRFANTAAIHNCSTLFEWVAARTKCPNLNDVRPIAEIILVNFPEGTFSEVNEHITNVQAMMLVNNEVKEIRGIENRLYHLDQILAEVKKICNDQVGAFQLFSQSKTRIMNSSNESSNINTMNLLKVCSDQFELMLANYMKLREFKRRCLSAKEEFVHNVHRRLKFIILFQTALSESIGELLFVNQTVSKAIRSIKLYKKIQKSPQMYISAVCEVVRRKAFSQIFMSKAIDLSSQLNAIYKEECERRSKFQRDFKDTVLKELFVGIDDKPSDYGIVPPKEFDTMLPKYTANDIDQLRSLFTDDTFDIQMPDFEAIQKPFLNLKFAKYDVMKEGIDEFEHANICEKTGEVMDQSMRVELPDEPTEKVAQAVDAEISGETVEVADQFAHAQMVDDIVEGMGQFTHAEIPKLDHKFTNSPFFNFVTESRSIEPDHDQMQTSQSNIYFADKQIDKTELSDETVQKANNQRDSDNGNEADESTYTMTTGQASNRNSQEFDVGWTRITDDRDDLKEHKNCNERPDGKHDNISDESSSHSSETEDANANMNAGASSQAEIAFERQTQRMLNELEELKNQCLLKDQKIAMFHQQLHMMRKDRNYCKDTFDMSRYNEKYLKMTSSTQSSSSYSLQSESPTMQTASHATIAPIISQPRALFTKLLQIEKCHKLSLHCHINDIVLIVWSPEHMSYVVVSDMDAYTFVHPDSYKVIGLGDYHSKMTSVPLKLIAFARVLDCECCLTKKSNNRYNIPLESKLYRIKVDKLDENLDYLNKIAEKLNLNVLFPDVFRNTGENVAILSAQVTLEADAASVR